MSVYVSLANNKEWLTKEMTPAQIRIMNDIVDVIPELKEKKNKCKTRGEASRFIDNYKKKYNEIKKDRIAMLEEETWRNISDND